jgi:hypothetical protein
MALGEGGAWREVPATLGKETPKSSRFMLGERVGLSGVGSGSSAMSRMMRCRRSRACMSAWREGAEPDGL